MKPLYAHYFAGTDRKVLAITDQPALAGETIEEIKEIEVPDEAEARRIAAECGAKCWNF